MLGCSGKYFNNKFRIQKKYMQKCIYVPYNSLQVIFGSLMGQLNKIDIFTGLTFLWPLKLIL